MGFGLRDHSWGPRFWQAPWYYRWLTANVGQDFGFMGSRVARRTGRAPGAASSGRTASSTTATTLELIDDVRRRRPLPRGDHRGAALVALGARSGGFTGR